ncbi:hypothetical protein FEM48_Zijuj01G0294500 [Ziziphus jujuba var. spinosa]|uniref:Myb/SANT-like domain-containing protein n=1 Tax=Ziziphus jujuba var. spinosa TaxID=714518 RepID=A0A978W5R0_ZIZJJ|nr:hypothetical protein FEM48_Zijuj01G0294500 [Ziziphus jujuba var. spinosa]
MDCCLIDLILEQVHKLNKMDYTIENQVLMDMVALVEEIFGLQHDKDVSRSCYKSLEKQFLEMKGLLDWRGFWDTQMQNHTEPKLDQTTTMYA